MTSSIVLSVDDFHNDILTGAYTSHQKTSLEHCSNLSGERIKHAKVLSSTLKDMT